MATANATGKSPPIRLAKAEHAQLVAFPGDADMGEQLVHGANPAMGEYVFAGHVLQLVDPSEEEDPALQLRQAALEPAPMVVEYVPALQPVQAPAPARE